MWRQREIEHNMRVKSRKWEAKERKQETKSKKGKTRRGKLRVWSGRGHGGCTLMHFGFFKYFNRSVIV